jgi:periplasmic iron binding protein
MKQSSLNKFKKALAIGAVALSALTFQAGVSEAAGFQEYPIGDEQEAAAEHFKVALVYFQPVAMEPSGSMLAADKADIHIETDIHATEGNDTGFGVGEWIPYLTIHYKFTKRETGEVLEGTFMPMNADDGPHYGANLKMLGAGTYDCDFTIDSPVRQNYAVHTDAETGVKGRFWEKPVQMHWVFNYVPRKW